MKSAKPDAIESADARRRGRPFNTYGGEVLSEETALREALSIVEQGGLKALTIQQLAKRLEVSRAPIYALYKSRDELVGAVVDRVILQIKPENTNSGDDWKDKVRRVIWASLKLYKRYPEVSSELIRTGFPDSDAGRKASNAYASIFKEAGAPVEKIPSLILSVSALAIGLDLQFKGQAEREAEGDKSPIAKSKLNRRRGTTLPKEPMDEQALADAVEVLVLGLERFVEQTKS